MSYSALKLVSLNKRSDAALTLFLPSFSLGCFEEQGGTRAEYPWPSLRVYSNRGV